MKLIKLTDTRYIVVDDSEIKETGVYAYHTILKKVDLIQSLGIDNEYCKRYKKITHSIQPLELVDWENGAKGKRPAFDKIKPLSLSEVEEAIKDNPSENNEWNICFDKNSKMLIMNV